MYSYSRRVPFSALPYSKESGIQIAGLLKKTRMKKLLILPALLICFSCGQGDSNGEKSNVNADGNVEQHSGENISPQLENQGEDRFTVDSLSDNDQINQEQKEDLH